MNYVKVDLLEIFFSIIVIRIVLWRKKKPHLIRYHDNRDDAGATRRTILYALEGTM